MKANELRVGNLVSYHENISVVHGITDPDYGNGIHIHYEHTCIGCDEKLIEPIQLTGKWLVKFGFEEIPYSSFFLPGEIVEEKTKCYWYSLKVVSEFPDLEIHIHFEHDNLITIIIDDHTKVQYIKFVHQLQNLYFSLTGKELTIKS